VSFVVVFLKQCTTDRAQSLSASPYLLLSRKSRQRRLIDVLRGIPDVAMRSIAQGRTKNKTTTDLAL